MWAIATVAADPQSTHEILVTLAERPHPFPSRTRKLSSPAPKILRGQPFGKIGRRQDFCVTGIVIRSQTRPQCDRRRGVVSCLHGSVSPVAASPAHVVARGSLSC